MSAGIVVPCLHRPLRNQPVRNPPLGSAFLTPISRRSCSPVRWSRWSSTPMTFERRSRPPPRAPRRTAASCSPGATSTNSASSPTSRTSATSPTASRPRSCRSSSGPASRRRLPNGRSTDRRSSRSTCSPTPPPRHRSMPATRELRATLELIAELRRSRRLPEILRTQSTPGALADAVATWAEFSDADRLVVFARREPVRPRRRHPLVGPEPPRRTPGRRSRSVTT